MSLGATTIFAHPNTHTYGAAPDNTVYTQYDTGGGMAGCGCGSSRLSGLSGLGDAMADNLKGLAVFGAIGLGAFALIGALKKSY